MVILSDLSEVLIRGVYGIDRLIEESYGSAVADEFMARCDDVEPFFFELMRGHLTEDDYWGIFFSDDIWPFGAEEVKTLVSLNFAEALPNALDVYKRIIEYPEDIFNDSRRIKGRPEVWIVSDHFIERKDELKAIHPEIFRFVSKEYWSYECGLIKKDIGFFHQLLLQNHLEPSEAIFVDDQMINVWAADDAGITGIVYRHPAQLERDLRSYGFRFSESIKPEW